MCNKNKAKCESVSYFPLVVIQNKNK